MPIEMHCAACGKRARLADQYAGKLIKCPGCGQPIRVPGDRPQPSTLPDVAPTVTLPDMVGEPTQSGPVRSFSNQSPPAHVVSNPNPTSYYSERPGVHQVVQVNLPSAAKGNPLAIATLVLGVIAALICWIPFLGLIALPVAAIGCLLGIPAVILVLAAKRPGLAASASGLALSFGSACVALMITGGTISAINKAIEPRPVVAAKAADGGPKPGGGDGGRPDAKLEPATAPAPPPAPAPAPAKPDFPSIAGFWQEGPDDKPFHITITQSDDKFTATCAYQHEEHGLIEWTMTGTISKAGNIKGTLLHTRAPIGWQDQTRTGKYSAADGTISGRVVLQGGGEQDFEWKFLGKGEG